MPDSGFRCQYIGGVITKWIYISGTTVASSRTRHSSSTHWWHHHTVFPSPVRAFASKAGATQSGLRLKGRVSVANTSVASSQNGFMSPAQRWHHHTVFPSPIRTFASRGGAIQSGLRLGERVSVADTSVASSQNGFHHRHKALLSDASFGHFFRHFFLRTLLVPNWLRR